MALAALAAGLACAGPTRQFPRSPVSTRHDKTVDHQPFRHLLKRYLHDGSVDYERWHAEPEDIQALDAYLGHLAGRSPELHPELFATALDQMSYWINLYNAIVIREVLRRWPLESVRDVSPAFGSNLIKGKGFFSALEFRIGNRDMSLDDIEHEVLRRKFKDARIHFAINCGSESCPVLSASPFAGSDLDRQLDQATRQFLASPANFAIDERRKTIRLSKIFEWYEDDFAAHVKVRGGGTSMLDFVSQYAPAELREPLRRARRAGFEIAFADYDWSVNQAAPSARSSASAAPSEVQPAAAPSNTPIPRLDLPLLGGGRLDLSSYRGKVVIIDIWATYCKPCRKSFPPLAEFDRARDDVVVVAISVDESDGPVASFVRALDLPFIIARDPDSEVVGPALGVSRLPTELIFDRRGRLCYRLEGGDIHSAPQLASRLADESR